MASDKMQSKLCERISELEKENKELKVDNSNKEIVITELKNKLSTKDKKTNIKSVILGIICGIVIMCILLNFLGLN